MDPVVPSSHAYPATFAVDHPERITNWKPMVQWLLAIPHYVVVYLLGIASEVVAIVAWFVILFTGKLPEGLAGLPSYTVGGQTIDLAYQGLETGPRDGRVSTLNPAIRIPPTVLKSIAWIEANWSNASGLVPFGGVGPTLVSPA